MPLVKNTLAWDFFVLTIGATILQNNMSKK